MGPYGLIRLNTGNPPGPDIVRIDRLRALSRFYGWWCMAVLSWWSDCLVNSVNERDLGLLNSRIGPFHRALELNINKFIKKKWVI